MEPDRREITPDLIRSVAEKIIEHFDPRRIVLFGSWARGDAGPDSDLDLFIEMESDLSSRAKRAAQISRIFGLHWWPMDIFVYTPEEVEQVRGIHGTLFSIVEDEGKVLYEDERRCAPHPPPHLGGVAGGRLNSPLLTPIDRKPETQNPKPPARALRPDQRPPRRRL